jgi:rare lipoprotein A
LLTTPSYPLNLTMPKGIGLAVSRVTFFMLVYFLLGCFGALVFVVFGLRATWVTRELNPVPIKHLYLFYSIFSIWLLAACAPATQSAVTASATAQTLESSEGRASWYGAEFAGRRTANGEIYDPSQLTAAHKTLPFGTFVRVTNPSSGQNVVVRINDRGPFKPGRVIDVSRAAAEQIGMIGPGTLVVRLELISQQSQVAVNGNVILAADAGLQGYNVITSQYRVGQLLLLSSATHPQPIIVRVASANMPVSSGIQMFAPNELFTQLGDKVMVVVGN